MAGDIQQRDLEDGKKLPLAPSPIQSQALEAAEVMGVPKIWMVLFHGQSMYKWTKYGVPPLNWKLPYGWDEEAHPAISLVSFFSHAERETCWYFSFLFLNLPRSCENPNGRTPMGDMHITCCCHVPPFTSGMHMLAS